MEPSTESATDEGVRSDSLRRGGERVTEFIFQCPGCGQEIEVNGAMRESILEHGCPVCTTSPSASDFVTTVQ